MTIQQLIEGGKDKRDLRLRARVCLATMCRTHDRYNKAEARIINITRIHGLSITEKRDKARFDTATSTPNQDNNQ